MRKAISIAVQATENDWDNDDTPSFPRNDSPPLFSKGEIQDLCHKDSAVKKRSNYIKEMYGILNTIQDTTSCSVCKKLKIRLDKFKNYLSSESLSIRKKSYRGGPSPTWNQAIDQCRIFTKQNLHFLSSRSTRNNWYEITL